MPALKTSIGDVIGRCTDDGGLYYVTALEKDWQFRNYHSFLIDALDPEQFIEDCLRAHGRLFAYAPGDLVVVSEPNEAYDDRAGEMELVTCFFVQDGRLGIARINIA